MRSARVPPGSSADAVRPSQPVLVAAVGGRGMPERARREMGERRLVVADAVDDRHLAVVVEALHPLHRLVQAELRVDLQELRLLQADRRPVLVVGGVAVRHDGVQAVVAAEPLEDDEDPAAGRAGRRPAGLAEDVRHRPDAAKQAEPEAAGAEPHHLAPRNAGIAPGTLAGHRGLPLEGPPDRAGSPSSCTGTVSADDNAGVVRAATIAPAGDAGGGSP